MSFTVSLLFAVVAVLAPQGIKLPTPRQEPNGKVAVVTRPLAEVERFRRDLAGMRGASVLVERNLQQMSLDYPSVEELVIERLRLALARELVDLMVVARRFGSPKIGDELLFQLLARPLSEATQDAIETMVVLKGVAARPALQSCMRGRIAAARRAATDAYLRIVNDTDLDFALELVGDMELDRQFAGVLLLAAVPVEVARQRLCELLSREPSLAGAACAALISAGKPCLPQLQKIVAMPPVDRSFAYAVFAMVIIPTGTDLIPIEGTSAALLTFIRGSDPLGRALSAVALAELSYRGRAIPLPDTEVVLALIDVAEPQSFIANLDLVRRLAEAQLRQLTGRTMGRDSLPWREWWQTGVSTFLGMRANVTIDDKSLGGAQIVLHDNVRTVRLLGEDLADLPVRTDLLDYVLTRAQMQQALEELCQRGFMAAAAATPASSGLPLLRQLQIQVQGGRSQVAAPAVPTPYFEVLAEVIGQITERELWQQLRNPIDEPDRGAFWHAERKWFDTKPDDRAQSRHFLRLVLKAWQGLHVQQRGLVLSRLLLAPDRKDLLTVEDGLALLGLVRKAAKCGEQEQLLLELAANSPGDRVWRDAIDVATNTDVGRKAVERVFAVLGADRVLLALADERVDVRRAAIEEVVRSHDDRAAPFLLKLLADPDPLVSQNAIFAAGALALASARTPLIDFIIADDTLPLTRREALRALGKVGGDGAFAVLQRALGAPVAEDREAAMRGLGELRDPRAATQLAEIFAAGPSTATGELARYFLQRMGHKLVVPALQKLLENSNAAVHAQVVLLLGGYQDPTVIPDLVALLRQEKNTLTAATLLAGTIGLDVAGTEDRVVAMDKWYRAHREEAQWQWLIQACKVADFKTGLAPSQFELKSGLQPVPELARILVNGEPGRLRVLAAAVLRTVTGEDFGAVTLATPLDVRQSIAARYRVCYESALGAQSR
ncbi:MAG: HEAT repeat domain-containing protein [Planctomycetota bacterium]|nr:HEAT repeat domain-containing protein [Planctomycetota bacterium]